MKSERVEEIIRMFGTTPGYLEQTGWLRSMECGEVLDMDGTPQPWLTYPALDFLKNRVAPTMSVFEYGTGNSTLWWAKRVKKLVSCEHDKEWYAAFKEKVTMGNTTYLLRRCKGDSEEYAREILQYKDLFDVLVIDGRDRVNCAKNCLTSLRPGGVVIWDNSDREEDQAGYDVLCEAGFRRLDFWGLGALSTRQWCTSFFYRTENCLGI